MIDQGRGIPPEDLENVKTKFYKGYTTPEALWDYHDIASAYSADPAESKALIYEHIRKNFPDAFLEELNAVLGWSR